MRLMTPKEKAEALNPDFAENYISNIVRRIDEKEFEDAFGKVLDIVPEATVQLIPRLSLLFDRQGSGKNTAGFIFHDFSNGDSMAILPSRDIVLIRKGEEDKIITDFPSKFIDGRNVSCYRHNGEDVMIGNIRLNFVMDSLDASSTYRPEFTEQALDAFAKEDIYIEDNKIFVPKEVEHSDKIVVLLSINNPSSIKKKLENCIIYKDTGVTLKLLTENSKAIHSMSFRYGTSIKKSKLKIIENDEVFNIYFTKKKSSSKTLGKFSIFSI